MSWRLIFDDETNENEEHLRIADLTPDILEQAIPLDLRDPEMANKNRKLLKIWAYLGLVVYEDMKKDQRELKQAMETIASDSGNPDESRAERSVRVDGPRGT